MELFVNARRPQAVSAHADLYLSAFALILGALGFMSLDAGMRCTEASAEVTLTASNNILFQISDQTGGELVSPLELSGWPRLCIRENCGGGNCAPCGFDDIYDAGQSASGVELSGRQRVMLTQNIHNLEVTRRIFVPNSGQEDADGFIRYLDTLHNPSINSIEVSVRFGSIDGGQVGRATSQVWRTSTYEADFDASDRWALIDDAEPSQGDHNVAMLIYGAGGGTPDRVVRGAEAGHPQGLYWDYDSIVVPARSSLSLISFIVVEPNRLDALDEIRNLLRLRDVDATFGIDVATRAKIYNADLNPENGSPLADLNGPYNTFEGQPLSLSGANSFDPDDQELTFHWDLNDNGIFGEEGLESSGANLIISFPQNGSYPIALQVQDPGGKTDIDRVNVNVRNASPQITSITSETENFTIDEGGLLEVRVIADDTGTDDVLTYSFNWEGNGVFEDGEAISTHRYFNDGVYTASVRVRDQDGGETSQSFTVSVNNLPPIIQQIISNNPSSEGDQVTFQVQAFDPGRDQMTYRFDFENDGTIDEENQTGTATHIYPEDGVYTVSVTIRDSLNAEVEDDHYRMSVFNVSPEIHLFTADGDLHEGQEVTFSVSASDVGIFDSLTYEFDLDGLPGYEISQASPTLTTTFPDNGTYEINIRVSDDEDGASVSQMDINIENLPPTGQFRFEGDTVRDDVVVTADQGQIFTVYAEISDASPVDEESLTYFWDLDNDGVYERLSAGQSQQLRFDREGIYIIRCLVRDKDLGELTLEREISIAGRAPVVDAFTLIEDGPYYEGSFIRFHLIASDPDPITYRFDFDNDGTFDVEGDQAEVRYAFPNEGEYVVRARAEDSSGYVEELLSVSVLNVPPSIALNTGVNVGEGEDLEIEVSARDPGGEDVITVTVEFQDQVEIVDLNDGESRRFHLPTQDNGFIQITANAVDDFGGESEEVSIQAIIENRPPFIIPFNPPTAQEGVPYARVIPADDPAGLNDALFFGLIEPPPNVRIEEVTGQLLWSPTYEDFLNSPITFTVLVEDDDGGRLEQDITIPVRPLDEDEDGIPDTYELSTCERVSVCLDPTNPNDADADPDGDGRGALQEWREGSDPYFFEGPTVPEPISPISGDIIRALPISLIAGYVESDRPLFDEDGGLAQRVIELTFELYADENGDELIAQSDAIEQRATAEGETNSWTPSRELFEEDHQYWWRVRASDGPALSDWSVLHDFKVNIENLPPSAPEPSLPLDQSIISELKPTLTFAPSVDPDGDAIYYVIRLYRDTESGPIPDSGGQVDPLDIDAEEDMALEYAVADRLQENARYLWDVVAIDAIGQESEPSARWGFTVDLDNEAPSLPQIYAPSAGAVIDDLRPVFQGGGSVDQEGSDLSYHFQVRRAGEAESIAETSSEGVIIRGGIAEWRPEVDLIEDEEHIISLYTSDGVSQSGLATLNFWVSSENNPPPQPMLNEPVDGALVSEMNAALIWSAVEDPEGGRVAYKVKYCTQALECEETPLLSTRSYNLAGQIPAQTLYRWSVSAYDEELNTLGYGESWRVMIQGQSATQADGCSLIEPGNRTSTQSLFGLLFIYLSVCFYRKERLG